MKLNQVWLYSSYRFQIKGLAAGRSNPCAAGPGPTKLLGFFWLQETELFVERFPSETSDFRGILVLSGVVIKKMGGVV